MFFSKKALAMVLLLMGAGCLVLAVSQYNALVVNAAQSEVARPLTEAQISATTEQLSAMGVSDAEIAAAREDALKTVEEAIAKIDNSFWQTILLDVVLGVLLLLLGLYFYPKEHSH